jgi:multidrug efflux pump subunit AcrA (membrane-fusion protein)
LSIEATVAPAPSQAAAAYDVVVVGGGDGRFERRHAGELLFASEGDERDRIRRGDSDRVSGNTMSVSWPGTIQPFEQANIYARASGYISRRDVDIGSHVKAGQLLVEITAPELDHQIAQAEGTLAQMRATLE